VRCPFCNSEALKVLESRSAEDQRSIRRRRECHDCTQRFTTYERVEFAPMLVLKNGGSKEVYSREKLVSSIVRSCSKSQISALTIDKIIDKVESFMYQDFTREIPSPELGEMVMKELKAIDPMSYLRYASIFKKINSISEFVEEMSLIEDQIINQDLEFASFTRV
jgi:transcriptional repressor NrdR